MTETDAADAREDALRARIIALEVEVALAHTNVTRLSGRPWYVGWLGTGFPRIIDEYGWTVHQFAPWAPDLRAEITTCYTQDDLDAAARRVLLKAERERDDMLACES